MLKQKDQRFRYEIGECDLLDLRLCQRRTIAVTEIDNLLRIEIEELKKKKMTEAKASASHIYLLLCSWVRLVHVIEVESVHWVVD